MKSSINYYVAIATITFKAPQGWRPSMITHRKCFVCVKRNNAAVEREAKNTAEEWKQQILANNPGLEGLSYSIKIDTTAVCGFDILDKEGKGITK